MRGINCDVWIAPRTFGQFKARFELYFMANGWVIQESGAVVNNEPVMVRIDYDIPDNNGIIVKFVYLIFFYLIESI